MRLADQKWPLVALAFGLGLIGTIATLAAEAYTATHINVRTDPGTGSTGWARPGRFGRSWWITIISGHAGNARSHRAVAASASLSQ